MSLQVWLPLNGDLTNNGLKEYNLSMFRGTETYNASGKIGKCFYSNGVNTIKILNIIPDFYNYSAYSISAWFYIEARNTVHNGSAIISAGNWNSQVINLAVGGWSTDHYTELRISGTSWSKLYSYNFNLNTWYHVVVSCDGSKTYAYVNGVLIGDTQPSFLPSSIEGNDIAIGGATYYSGMQFFGRINDVRIYNHCLSQKEIKELSKGLVAHYLMNNPYATANLIPNGNGNDGRLGWISATYMSTTEIPPNQNVIKASFYSNNETTTYIPISQTTTYTLSVWLKAMQATGTTYPSIKPYDADKKIIMYYNSAEGFGQAYKTTLAQPLHKGDTVIYATDLSAWTTADNYYNYCAIFGYRDSFGRLYPDMGYTADSPQFASKGSTKTNIDKTNNTITLNSAFTGEDRPAGTMICQATAGGTWIYPWSSINLTTIQDWTQKTTTLNPITQPRLRYAKYINYLAYPGAYHAGITLTDDNSEQLIYDSSGHNYHGIPTSGLIISADTPRNRYSTLFPYRDQYVRIPNLYSAGYADTYTFSWWAKLPTITNSTMMWGYQDGNRLNIYMYTNNCYWNTGDGTSNPFGVAPSAWADGNFHHFAVTGDGTTTKLYVDGEFKANAKTYRGITGKVIFFNGWDTGTSYKFNGYISDFRLYATCLSADDIKQLYDTPVSIANNGTMFTQGEFVDG